MFNRLYTVLKENKRFTGALRWYMIWGLLVRAALLLGLTTLLALEGNFLLEWLLSWGLPRSSQEDLAEITTFSYVIIGSILFLGMILRAVLLYRIKQSDLLREPFEKTEERDEPGQPS